MARSRCRIANPQRCIKPAPSCSTSTQAVEAIAVGFEAARELAGVALAVEGVVDNGVGGRGAQLEPVGGVLQGGLVAGDLLVQTGLLGRHVGVPTLEGVGLPGRPRRGLFACGVAVPPTPGAFGFSPGPLGPGMGEVLYRLAGFGRGPHAAAGVEVGAGLAGGIQGVLGLAKGGGPVGEARPGCDVGGEGFLAWRRVVMRACWPAGRAWNWSRVRGAGSGRPVSMAKWGCAGWPSPVVGRRSPRGGRRRRSRCGWTGEPGDMATYASLGRRRRRTRGPAPSSLPGSGGRWWRIRTRAGRPRPRLCRG